MDLDDLQILPLGRACGGITGTAEQLHSRTVERDTRGAVEAKAPASICLFDRQAPHLSRRPLLLGYAERLLEPRPGGATRRA